MSPPRRSRRPRRRCSGRNLPWPARAVGEGTAARLLFASSCLIGLVVGLSLAGVPVTAQGPAPQAAPEEPEAVRYEVQIRGRMSESLRTLLGEASEMRRLSDRPPSNFLRLRRRAEADRDRLLQALRSRGYYGGAIEVRYDRNRDPVQVVFEVEPGPVYRLREIRLEVEPPDPELRPPTAADLGLKVGQPAQAQAIIDAEGRFLQLVREQGFPLAELGERRAVVDHDADAMDITFRIRPGPEGRFGDVQFSGIQG